MWRVGAKLLGRERRIAQSLAPAVTSLTWRPRASDEPHSLSAGLASFDAGGGLTPRTNTNRRVSQQLGRHGSGQHAAAAPRLLSADGCVLGSVSTARHRCCGLRRSGLVPASASGCYARADGQARGMWGDPAAVDPIRPQCRGTSELPGKLVEGQHSIRCQRIGLLGRAWRLDGGRALACDQRLPFSTRGGRWYPHCGSRAIPAPRIYAAANGPPPTAVDRPYSRLLRRTPRGATPRERAAGTAA